MASIPFFVDLSTTFCFCKYDVPFWYIQILEPVSLIYCSLLAFLIEGLLAFWNYDRGTPSECIIYILYRSVEIVAVMRLEFAFVSRKAHFVLYKSAGLSLPTLSSRTLSV